MLDSIYENLKDQIQLPVYRENLLNKCVRNKSIHEGLSGFLKQVGSLTMFLSL